MLQRVFWLQAFEGSAVGEVKAGWEEECGDEECGRINIAQLNSHLVQLYFLVIYQG